MNNTNRKPIDFMVAPATLSSNSLTLVWDKPRDYLAVTSYRVYQDEKFVTQTAPNKTHCTINNLSPETRYNFHIEAIFENETEPTTSKQVETRTKKRSEVVDVTKAPYYADGSGEHISTATVQKAINECPKGGIVLIPKEAVILTGAIELKSDMTFQIDGILKGSLRPEDYTVLRENRTDYEGYVNSDGLILTRYEGWEMYCYRSLLNAGYLNPDDRMEITCENLRICGSGTVYGGGNELGTAMKVLYADKKKYPRYVSDDIGGRRTRGRLLGLIQCKNVHLTGINIENPPCWTVHMIYCDTITTHGISIKSRGIDNGDGWDPDSSRNLMIFDTSFDTGDDCIAIKSGKNPEGNIIDIPTQNVRIFDLKMLGGNGMAIGSEQSGGVEGIYMRDCIIQNTNYGLELKAQKARGGYIRDVRMIDCEIDCFMAHSVDYNADGEAAETLPYFKNIEIKNTIINGRGRAVELIGFQKEEDSQLKGHYVRDVLMENVMLGKEQTEAMDIYMNACQGVRFKNVKMMSGKEPRYLVEKHVFNVRYE